MNIVDKESGKLVGIKILQPEAVQTEFKKWKKEKYPHFGILEEILIFPLALCIAIMILEEISMLTTAFSFSLTEGSLDLHLETILKNIAILSIFILLIYMSVLHIQYNKQAPEELKRR